MKKSKIAKSAALILGISIMLEGCTLSTDSVKRQIETGNDISSQATEIHFLEEEKRTEEVSEGSERIIVWSDNKLDDYHAVINYSVKKIEVMGEIPLGGALFVGEGGCVRHGNHNFKDYKKNWDGVNGITMEGVEFEVKIEADPEQEGDLIRTLAPISGKRGYVAYGYDYQDEKMSKCWLYELNETFQIMRRIPVELNAQPIVSTLMEDVSGRFHLICDTGGAKKNYVVLSSEGEILFEKETEQQSEFRAFGEGRVALCETFTGKPERRFSEVNFNTGELLELTVSKEEVIKEKLKNFYEIYAATPIDDQRIVWCGREGVCFYDVRNGETRVAYRWSNHGILPSGVSYLTVTADGFIALIYQREGSKEQNYLLLKPTEEKEELKSITIAVATQNKDSYEKAATFFQRNHPSYVINVRDDYDELNLLAQLGAGNGPVLIDTTLTGFEDMEALWQPLDGFLSQTHLTDELLPKALEFGKIGDVTYGIVREFQIETLLVPESGVTDWDYEGFLDALEKCDGAAYTDRYIEAAEDKREFYFNILQNSLSDNYYLNTETGEMIFGTADFDRVLRLSEKAKRCPPAESGQAVLDGTALCECDYVPTVYAAIQFRRKIEANGLRAIGYPTKGGARNILHALPPLTLRRTATEEEKEIAYTFLRDCLSKESIEASTFNLPVRKDVLEGKFMSYQEMVERDKEYGAERSDLFPELDWDKDVKFLYDMIEKGIVQEPFPAGLQSVFDEELGDYLAGRIDGKMLSEHLKNRTWLYLEEQK